MQRESEVTASLVHWPQRVSALQRIGVEDCADAVSVTAHRRIEVRIAFIVILFFFLVRIDVP